MEPFARERWRYSAEDIRKFRDQQECGMEHAKNVFKRFVQMKEAEYIIRQLADLGTEDLNPVMMLTKLVKGMITPLDPNDEVAVRKFFGEFETHTPTGLPHDQHDP